MNKRIDKLFSKRAIGAIIVSILFYILLGVGSFFFGNGPKDYIMNIMIAGLGSSIGWLLGVAASPYYVNEDTRFKTIIGSIVTFVSGFSVGSLKDIFNGLSITNINSLDIGTFRAFAFFIAFIASLQTTYAIRAYDTEKDKARKRENEKKGKKNRANRKKIPADIQQAA